MNYFNKITESLFSEKRIPKNRIGHKIGLFNKICISRRQRAFKLTLSPLPETGRPPFKLAISAPLVPNHNPIKCSDQ